MWLLYQALAALLLAAAAPFLLLARGRHYLPTLSGRLTLRLPEPPPRAGGAAPLWLHAVSVGEVGVAAALARHLPQDRALVVTTVTPTGQERARAAFAGRPAAVGYLPVELRPAVERFFRRLAPGALILVEGDYWPLVLRAARRRGVPVAVVNGRVGDASFRRLSRLRPLLGPLLAPVDRFGVQSAEDGRRLLALGVPAERVTVTGNLKYDVPEPPENAALTARLEALAGGRPLLVAGSTMPGEEEQVLEAFAAAGGGTAALLVLAPRHPERWESVADFLADRGVAVVRRSAVAERAGRADVVLLDSLGELAGLYRRATAAFVGGTLVPTGGHNPLEPARFGVPLAVGPSMTNFRDMAAEFDAAAAWERVADGAALGAAWGRWLADPAAAAAVGDRARDLVERNRGAVGRTLALLAPFLGVDGASR